MDDLADLDATALAALVRKKEVSPLELVDATIARIEAGNERLNAVIWKRYDEARREAEGALPDGPFRGVPFLVKDVVAKLAGAPFAEGSRLGDGYIADHDSELVRRQKRAGLIVVGKTNVPEFGILPTTESAYWGRCKNPWDTARTPGGSSGGSAAAVASRWVPMAHANDGGGSIRIPASCCGLFGLKPTRGRNPLGPDHGDIFHGLVVEHAVTRSVRDSAALLDATAGPDVGDPYAAPPPERPYVDELGRDPGRLRIAITRKATSGVPVHPDCVAAVDEAAKLLESLGHHVEEDAPALDGEAVKRGFISMWGVCIGAAVDEMAELVGKKITPENVEPLTWAFCQMSAATTAREHLKALSAVRRIARQVSRFFVDYDMLLSPTNAEPPPALGSFDPVPGNPLAGIVRAGLFVPFTPIANVTGQPAMSLPLHMAGGLPIGVQLMGRFGAEGMLFRLAAQLEAARPWAERRPPSA